MATLDALVNQYAAVKDTVKINTDIAKSLSDDIKTRISSGESVSETCPYTATISKIDKSYFDEKKLLAKLKEIGKTDCVKTKEYVDMDLLENEMYQGTITVDDLKDCKVSKTEIRLNVNKKKGDK